MLSDIKTTLIRLLSWEEGISVIKGEILRDINSYNEQKLINLISILEKGKDRKKRLYHGQESRVMNEIETEELWRRDAQQKLVNSQIRQLETGQEVEDKESLEQLLGALD
jgi:hypothetical protein